MVLNNISVISWRLSVLWMEETGVRVLLGTDCIGSCTSTYYTITTTPQNVRRYYRNVHRID
jgi:hypothetical protein